MEVKIPFGPADIFVQYGTSEELIQMNSDHLRGHEETPQDTALFELAQEAGHDYEMRIRVEFTNSATHEEKRAISQILIDVVNGTNPPLGLSYPYGIAGGNKDFFFIENNHLMKKEECDELGQKALEAMMRARQRWFSMETDGNENTKDRAAVAGVLSKLAPRLDAADRLAAENIIVDKLGPAKHKAGRADAGKRASALAFVLDDDQRASDRLTSMLGGVGISGDMAEQIKKQLGEAIYRQ